MPPLNINEDFLSSAGFDTSWCSQPETEEIRNPLIIGMDDDSSSSSFARNYKCQRSVSFHQDISVIAVPRLHHAQEMCQRWYSRRELYLIKRNIRSLLRKHERRLRVLEQQEVLMASSSSSYFGDDCLFGLERHMTTEKAIIRQNKFNAKLAVFSEQFIQRQQGQEDATQIGMVYAAYAAQCQQHAITAALTNAMESSESSRPYEEEEGKTMDSNDEQDLYLGETKQHSSLANHFGSCWAWLS
jgi:hypothetical protein